MSLVNLGCLRSTRRSAGSRRGHCTRLPPVVSAWFALFLMGFRWAFRWGGSNRETCPEEVSAPVVAGCLLLSRAVFEDFGVLDVDPESTVDTTPAEAHLRCMTSRARGMHRALFTSVPIHGSIVRSPRPRGLTGTGRRGAEDSSGPRDRRRHHFGPGDAPPVTHRDRARGWGGLLTTGSEPGPARYEGAADERHGDGTMVMTHHHQQQCCRSHGHADSARPSAGCRSHGAAPGA